MAQRRLALLALVAVLLAALAPCLRADEQLYTCGMHPQIIKKEPGNCPICGMALTPVRSNAAAKAGGHTVRYYTSTMNPGEVSDKPGKDSMGMDMVAVYDDAATDARLIHIDAETVQRMNLKTGPVTRGPVVREFRTVGTIAFDEQGLRDLTLRYDAWIEKLLVSKAWASVKAGDPLFEVYAPDVYNAELNYLVALRTEGAAGGPLSRAALARLQLFNLPQDALAELERTGEAKRTFVYPSPADGVVIEKSVVAGQMVKAGERIYRLADLSSVWVLAQVFEQDLAFVGAGQEATVRVTYGPERFLTGRVELVLAQVDEQTRAATARIILPNPDGTLRPGMFVDVRFAAKLAEDAVLVPDLAVLRSGERNTVFIARDGGTFEPREVRLGSRSQGNLYEVLSGLTGAETVVISGQFMLDSESQLRDAIQKMLASGQSPAPARPVAATRGVVGMDEGSALPEPAKTALLGLADTTIDAAEALASDDLAGYRRTLPRMRTALTGFMDSYAHAEHGPLGRYKGALAEPADLAAARRDFAYFGTAVSDLVRENGLNRKAGLHLFQCPMAPGIGTGRWLSRTATLRNPFYGSSMLQCGDELDAPRG